MLNCHSANWLNGQSPGVNWPLRIMWATSIPSSVADAEPVFDDLEIVSVDVDELDIAKLSTVIEAKYGSIDAAQKQLGAVQDIRQTFIDFQVKFYG